MFVVSWRLDWRLNVSEDGLLCVSGGCFTVIRENEDDQATYFSPSNNLKAVRPVEAFVQNSWVTPSFVLSIMMSHKASPKLRGWEIQSTS